MIRDIYPPQNRKPGKKSDNSAFSLLKYLTGFIVLLIAIFFSLGFIGRYIDRWLDLEPVSLDISKINMADQEKEKENSQSLAKETEAEETEDLTNSSAQSDEPVTAVKTEQNNQSSPGDLDKSQIKIKVLNGNAIYGTASKVKAILEQDGFTVAAVGNAQNQTYPKTVVYYQTGKKTAAESVNQSLVNNRYSASIEENANLVGENDLLVVIGKK